MGSTRPSRARIQSGDQFECGRTDARIEIVGLDVRQRPAFQDQVRPLANPVDRVNGRVEPLQIMRAVDERSLPAPFEIEVINRRIAKIEGKRSVLEAGEDRISRLPQPV